MKHYYISFSAILLTALMFNACAPAYVPNAANVPMLSNENELQLALHTGTAGYDPQIAYAATKCVGVMVNGSFADRTNDSTNNFHKHTFGEVGIGYYKNLGGSARFEVFGGYGIGKVQGYYENSIWTDYQESTYNRIFLQPAIGIAHSVVDFSFTPRCVYVTMMQGNATGHGMYIEPIITLKLGYKYVKAVMQFGCSVPINSNKIAFDHQFFISSIGLQATIGRLYEDGAR